MIRSLSLSALIILAACGSHNALESDTINEMHTVDANVAEPDYVNMEAAAMQPMLEECYAHGGKSARECLDRIDASDAKAVEAQEFSAPFPGKYGTTNGMWAFGKVTDRMRGETITEAYAVSKSLGDDELRIRFQRKDGITFKATLEPQRPYYFVVCGQACSIPISVDGKMQELIARNANAGATELEAFDPAGFERLVKRAQKLFIELPMDDGDRQYEFRTDGLDWSAAEGAEPMYSN